MKSILRIRGSTNFFLLLLAFFIVMIIGVTMSIPGATDNNDNRCGTMIIASTDTNVPGEMETIRLHSSKCLVSSDLNPIESAITESETVEILLGENNERNMTGSTAPTMVTGLLPKLNHGEYDSLKILLIAAEETKPRSLTASKIVAASNALINC